ncbi:hypothetical protein B7P43_G17488 [Cryptotermes secundus]|uniref:Envelope fusion protein n=2 Tax=Cryptotermes secundus TaxID=105785 RepID=A0A2J7R072_9NEOP|nr:hypothetical protein B7P43_G17488 [Cryptotermes secundus]
MAKGLDVRNEPIESSPGLYYQHEGEARLSTSDWKVMTYLDLQQASANVDTIERYVEATINFCKKHDSSLWLNLTECRTTILDATRRLQNLKEMRGLVTQLTKTERNAPRKKRGLFNFVGQISHTLFGILDSENEEAYNSRINQLEGEQSDLIKLAREQMVVVKSTLKSVNKTLNDVSKNEMILEKGLRDIRKFINEENGELKEKYTYTSMLVTLNDHAIQIQRALEEVKNEYDVILQSCLNARSGIIQPQVLSPGYLIQILKSSRDSFPRDLQVPVQLSEAYTYLLINVITIETYVVRGKLVYVVRVPLVTHHVYDIYKVIPFPIKVNETRNKYTFIQPDKEYMLIDSTRQYYVKLRQENLNTCKKMSEEQLVCKQDFPLLISHSSDDCEVSMLQPIRLVPRTCTQRVIELKETLWIPLKRNSWIYIAPVPSQMTILCPAQQPTELEIKNSGILSFLLDCTGYSNKVMIRSITSHYVNHTGKDIIPALYLPLDCCENDKTKIHLDELQLETPLKNVLTHNDELRLASHKVEDVEKLIEEQEWKLKHEKSTRQLSVLSSIGAAALALLIGIMCCCCCCRCCRNCWPRFVKWAWDDSKCSAIIFKPRIINSVHTSSDSLHRRGAMLSLATHVDDEDTPKEFTEMTPMNATIGVRVSRTSSRNQAVGKR